MSPLEIHSALKLQETHEDAIITIDKDGVICLANASVLPVFGYSPQELLGRPITTLMGKEHASLHPGYILEYLTAGERNIIGNNRELSCLHKSGDMFSASLTVREFISEGSTYFTGVVRDITEHRNREEELERKNRELVQSNTLLERYSYISAHDLKAPLRSLSGMVYNFVRVMERWMVDGKEPDLAKVRKGAKLIAESTGKMSDTIDDTLRYCQAGQSLKLSWCSLDSIISNAMSQARVLIEEHHVTINKEKARIKLHCDQSQLTQMFYNLITNAIQYNDSECKSIRIEAYRHDKSVMVHVTDNGRGIEEDMQHKVFELFQKLQNAGSGVGGAIVHRIVTGHGGTISIDSVVGQGSTFNIKLPIKDI